MDEYSGPQKSIVFSLHENKIILFLDNYYINCSFLKTLIIDFYNVVKILGTSELRK